MSSRTSNSCEGWSAAARTTVPAASCVVLNDPAYGFLGAPAWLIPQPQIPGIVWAGWNTESLNPRDVSVRLSAVDGSGRVAVFLTGLTPTVLVDSANVTATLVDGSTVSDRHSGSPGFPAHHRWSRRPAAQPPTPPLSAAGRPSGNDLNAVILGV